MPKFLLFVAFLALVGADCSLHAEAKNKSEKSVDRAQPKPEKTSPTDYKRDTNLLKVTVELTEKLPPLPSQLRPGSHFDYDKLPKDLVKAEDSRWYQVPLWLAGEYAYGPMEIYLRKDFEKQLESNEIIKEKDAPSGGRYRGIFSDKNNNPWQKCFSGFLETQSPKIFRLDQEFIGHLDGADTYVEFSSGMEIYTNGHKTIESVQRVERLRTFVRQPDGPVKVSYSEKSFDDDGYPRQLICRRGTMKKLVKYMPYEKGEYFQGKEYSELAKEFCAYLKATKRADLIPESLQVAAASFELQSKAPKASEDSAKGNSVKESSSAKKSSNQ